MNINKAQKIIFNELISGGIVGMYDFDESNVFITPDGTHGFVLPLNSIQLNIAKMKKITPLNLASVVKEENLCHLSKELLLQEHPKAYLRKLKNGDRNIYFNAKKMECFQNPKFYNEGNTSMIVVTEDISPIRQNSIVGVILPVRVVEEHYM